MVKKSPTALSVEHFKKHGFIYSKTEQTIPHCFIKRDTAIFSWRKWDGELRSFKSPPAEALEIPTF